MKKFKIEQVQNGFVVIEYGIEIYVFETFQGLCDHLAIEFEVPTVQATEPMNVKREEQHNRFDLKYPKADCCDYGKAECLYKATHLEDKVSRPLCTCSCFMGETTWNKEAFEAINKPCHGGYQPLPKKED